MCQREAVEPKKLPAEPPQPCHKRYRRCGAALRVQAQEKNRREEQAAKTGRKVSKMKRKITLTRNKGFLAERVIVQLRQQVEMLTGQLRLADDRFTELRSTLDMERRTNQSLQKRSKRAFKQLHMPALAHNFVKRAISMSLDKAARERELIAVLLCALCGEGLYTESVERGFMMLMESIEDLELDVPAAKTELSVFVARAVADDILPMDFLSKSRVMSKPEAERTPVEDVLAQAHGRLRREGSLASELSSVAEVYAYWGGGESEIARAKRVIAEAQ